jgi:type IX secretion system PorP/SprF family membrane protein
MRRGLYISIVLILLSGFGNKSAAQQDPLYSMYVFDKVLINPAYAGSSNWAVGTLKYREQARSFQGHPVTQTFNFHGPIQRKHLGLGFKVINDQLGIQNTLNAALFVSYHLTFAGGKLSAGLEAGVLRRSIKYNELILTRYGDQAIPGNEVTGNMPDLAAGFYYHKKQFYLGFSAAHLLPATVDVQNPVHLPARHLYLIIGNVFQIHRDWTLDPSVLVKYPSVSSPQVDANLMLYFDDKFGVGAQYRSNQAIVPMLRIEVLRGLRIAYSYDYSLASTQSPAHGAHEIILSYGVKLAPPPAKREVHPRYYF